MDTKRPVRLQTEDSKQPGLTADVSRRQVLVSGAAAFLAAAIPLGVMTESRASTNTSQHSGDMKMDTVTTKDGVTIFFKDWGTGQPIVFSHGWPLTADDWDTQMTFFLAQGFRVIAHDRRGHGRSTQVSEGHDMDHYASDASAVAEHLNLKNAVHIGHSTGGGEVARYVAKYGQPQGRVAKAVLVSAVPPLMVKTASNPGGTPIEVFDGFRKALAANRSQFFLDVPSGPFYGFNRPGAKVSQGIIENWWRSRCRRSSCRARTTRLYPTKTLHSFRPSCSRTVRSRSIRDTRTGCAVHMRT
jgi:non-heme chloroperoxidase